MVQLGPLIGPMPHLFWSRVWFGSGKSVAATDHFEYFDEGSSGRSQIYDGRSKRWWNFLFTMIFSPLDSSCDQPTQGQSSPTKVVDEMENHGELFRKWVLGILLVLMPRLLSTIPSQRWSSNSSHYQVIVDELQTWWWLQVKKWKMRLFVLDRRRVQQGSTWSLRPNGHRLMLFQVDQGQLPVSLLRYHLGPTHGPSWMKMGQRNTISGRGDMLFKNRSMKIIRFCLQSFISDDDVERIVNFVKEQAEADYDDAFDPGEVSESDFDGGMGGSWMRVIHSLKRLKALVI